MLKLIIAPRAKVDLKKIGRYTQKKWGLKQRDKYLFGLSDRFQWLTNHSKMGTHRLEIAEGYYSFPHERHTIFYTVSSNVNVNIIGVVGTGQSLEKYFN
jgi:toxin ParE1/3/4